MFDSIKKVFGGGKRPPVPESPPGAAHPDALESSAQPRLRDRFPELEKLAVNLSIRAPFDKIEPTVRGFSMGPDALANFVFRCKNTDCQSGGFDLSAEIEEMVSGRENSRQGRRVCQGWDGKDNVGHQRCYYELNFIINARYL